MPILSRHRPLGVVESMLSLNEAELPLKHSVLSLDDPPNARQKSVSDCQISVSLDEETGSPANGEFFIEISLQASQTSLQKSLVESLDGVELAELVELQRYGTVRSVGSVLNKSAENGSHFAQRMDFMTAAQVESDMFMDWNCFWIAASSVELQQLLLL